MEFKVEKSTIEAKPRTLSAKWTIDTRQDIQFVNAYNRLMGNHVLDSILLSRTDELTRKLDRLLFGLGINHD